MSNKNQNSNQVGSNATLPNGASSDDNNNSQGVSYMVPMQTSMSFQPQGMMVQVSQPVIMQSMVMAQPIVMNGVMMLFYKPVVMSTQFVQMNSFQQIGYSVMRSPGNGQMNNFQQTDYPAMMSQGNVQMNTQQGFVQQGSTVDSGDVTGN